jgi:hypothetical protein
MLVFLLSLFIVGLIAGGLARLIVPGRDPIGTSAPRCSASSDRLSGACSQACCSLTPWCSRRAG